MGKYIDLQKKNILNNKLIRNEFRYNSKASYPPPRSSNQYHPDVLLFLGIHHFYL